MLKRKYNADGNSHYVTRYLKMLRCWVDLGVDLGCSSIQNDRLDEQIPNLALEVEVSPPYN